MGISELIGIFCIIICVLSIMALIAVFIWLYLQFRYLKLEYLTMNAENDTIEQSGQHINRC